MHQLTRRHLAAALTVAAAAAAVPASASALTTRYEAEDYTATSNSQWVAANDDVANTSAGKYHWLYSNGALEIPVTTGVKSVTVRVKGTRCYDPSDTAHPGNGVAAYQIATIPGSVQQSPYQDPDPATYGFSTWGAGSAWNSWTFTLPYQYNTPLPGATPNKIQVKFVNDFRTSSSCDRNLAIDYVDVVS